MLFRTVVNYTAIIASAAFAGAMIFIGIALSSYWRNLPPEQFLNWFSENSFYIARAIPVFVGPSVLAIIGSLIMSWRNVSARPYWISSLLCLVGVGIVTVAIHLPANSTFVLKSVELEKVSSELWWWTTWHIMRILLGLSSAVCAIVATVKERS
jgi:hypothetical protein